MKRVMTSALVLSLLAGSAAVAQDRPGMQYRGVPNRERAAPQPSQGGQAFQGGGQGQRQDRGDSDRGGFQRGDRGGDRGDRQPPQAAPQPQAAQRPQAQIERDRGLGGGRNAPDNRGRGPDNRSPDNRGQDNRGQDNRGQDYRGPDNRGPDRGGPDRGPRGDDRDDRRYDDRNRPGMQYRGVPYDRGDRGPAYRPGDQRLRDRDRGRQQYDQRRWAPIYRAPQRFRGPVWRPPVGFYAYNWRFGDYLPRTWFGGSYYLNWMAYGLPMPPIGCEWVRVGDDAVLVDTWTGRVLSVSYNLFW